MDASPSTIRGGRSAPPIHDVSAVDDVPDDAS